MLVLDEGVLDATFAALRRCGGGVQECVAYWLGPTDQDDRVDQIVQPEHRASARHYEVESAWLTDFFLQLRDGRRGVRAQVHTHPGPFVEHSPTDNCFALAPSVGFVSLVLPYFATGQVGLDGAYAAQVTDGGWTEIDPSDGIRWT